MGTLDNKGSRPLENSSGGGKILFLGNSITVHGKCEYWFGVWGMAASSENEDYVHIVVNALKQKTPVSFEVYNLYPWEANALDRAQPLSLMEPLMKSNLDAVVVQMGENIFDMTTLKEDFTAFVKKIKTKSPKAKILVLGNFWTNDAMDEIKREVSKNEGAIYISLKDIQAQEYIANLGTVVRGDDGSEHIIEHKGVALHPGNSGMAKIAEKILTALGANG